MTNRPKQTSRVFGWKDVVLNVVSSIVDVAFTAWKTPAKENPYLVLVRSRLQGRLVGNRSADLPGDLNLYLFRCRYPRIELDISWADC